MKSHARAAVIGGGIMGCAMLYQLTRHGCRDAVLIEKGELTSGSTWHAAGQVPHFSDSPLMARVQYESFESYKNVEKETGEPSGVHAVGSLRIARSDDEVREYKRFLAFAKRIGIQGDIIGPNETRSLWPLLEFDGFKGALHTTLDGYTDPSQTTNNFAKAARAQGAEVYRHARVTGITRTTSGEWRIQTTKGDITVEIIINAAGFWGPEISAMVGGTLPIVAMEHEYLVTEQAPELAEFAGEMPVLRDMNVPTYVRQERKGLLVACYESHPIFWGLDGIPKDFGQELFAPDVERAAPQLEMTYEMIPALQKLGIKTVVNGPTGRTADLKPCVGPAHGLPHYYTLCGVVGGFLQSGFAKYLAEWIFEGEPSIDLTPVDVRRFGDYATQSYAVAKVAMGHAYSNPVYYPHGEPSRGRPARTSPLYGVLKAKGAAFGVDNGWEVPSCFPGGADPGEAIRFERQDWVAHSAAEVKAAKKAAVLLDLSSRSKFIVCGPDAELFLDRACASALPKTGEISRGLFLTPKGHVAALLTVERLADGRFYLSGEALSEQRDLDWLQRHLGKADAQIENVTARDGLLWLAGPKAAQVLKDAGQKAELAPGACGEALLGLARVHVRRVDDVASPAFEIVHAVDSQVALYEGLMAAGAAHGLKDVGRRAYDALRVAAGVGRWGADFAVDSTAAEAGLAGLVGGAKTDFVGRAALGAKGGRRLASLRIAPNGSPVVDPWGQEAVYAGDREVGVVSSGAFAPALEGSLALALVDETAAKPGTKLEVEILGVRRSATIVDPRA